MVEEDIHLSYTGTPFMTNFINNLSNSKIVSFFLLNETNYEPNDPLPDMYCKLDEYYHFVIVAAYTFSILVKRVYVNKKCTIRTKINSNRPNSYRSCFDCSHFSTFSLSRF